MNYERINWENAPSTDTPLDADNLNRMDEALDTLNRELAHARTEVARLEETAAALSSRIAAIAQLKDESTTGDAELVDGRVAKDGTIYPLIGDAIRGQVEDLEDSIAEVASTIPAVDDDLETVGAAADAKKTGDEISAIKQDLTELDERLDDVGTEEELLRGELLGATQTVTFDSNGNPVMIVYSKNNTTIRTDEFTWTANTVTEVRTLSSGKYITIITNLTTLEQTISEVTEAS